MNQSNNPKPNNSPQQVNKWSLASLALDMGFIIALPLVALALGGKWLDTKLGTDPWLTLVGIILAITSTTVWLTKKFKKLIK